MRAVPRNINSMSDCTLSLFGTNIGGRTNPNATPSCRIETKIIQINYLESCFMVLPAMGRVLISRSVNVKLKQTSTKMMMILRYERMTN